METRTSWGRIARVLFLALTLSSFARAQDAPITNVPTAPLDVGTPTAEAAAPIVDAPAPEVPSPPVTATTSAPTLPAPAPTAPMSVAPAPTAPMSVAPAPTAPMSVAPETTTPLDAQLAPTPDPVETPAAPTPPIPEVAEAPASAEPAAPEPTTRSERAAALRIPVYQRVRPAWATQITSSMRALGDKSLYLNRGVNKIRALSLQFDYQPKAWQSAGVFAVGLSGGIYPELPDLTVTASRLGMWSVGGQMRYQARYFREQPIVPYAGLGLEVLNYRFVNGASGHVSSVGGVGGVMFLLNVLDEGGAADFYANYEVSRSYLVAELRGYSGKDINVALGGSSLFFGLRIEY